MSKYEKVHSELQQYKTFKSHLLAKIIKLELNALINSQYRKRETIELNSVPVDITEDVLEENSCKVLSVTGVKVVSNNLHTCHRMKTLNRVIMEFKYFKQKNYIMNKHKNLGNKSQELINLKFSGRLFVSEGMSHENQQLPYRC